jgi:hypothetical protein
LRLIRNTHTHHPQQEEDTMKIKTKVRGGPVLTGGGGGDRGCG